MNAVFINGWGISQDTARTLLEGLGMFDSVAVIQPVRQWKELASGLAGKADVLIGYSTGAFLLMDNLEFAKAFSRRVLLAPFLDFKLEGGMGGKTRAGQLKVLMRWLGRDPMAALADFYAKAKIGQAVPDDLPVSPLDLVWGIERLLEETRDVLAMGGFEAHIGNEDALIDAARLKELVTSVTIHEGVGHGLEELLKAWKEGVGR